MKQKKMHMIGNAHIDPVWLWQWQEGFQEVKASFRSALDRIKEFDDFIFTTSSAAFFEWIEQSDPSMFDEIKQRVAEGRIELVGGWWIQPDCNLPGGESFVRQGLIGQHYFQEKFSKIATVGYNVDSFGHHKMLPQILKKMRLDYYVFMRPNHLEKDLPRLFWWEADDGSKVLTYRIPFTYTTWGKELVDHITQCADIIEEPVDEIMSFYGVGNHGGGPTIENIENIIALNEREDLPELSLSSPERYFHNMLAKNISLPVVNDDFQHHASGCYAVHSGIKKWNREAEHILLTAEKFSMIANKVTGQSYPTDYDLAWKNVLFNQFHDILAGTSIKPAYKDARDHHGEAISIATRGLNYAIQSLSWNIQLEAEEGMKPIVIFNPHGWANKVNVELEFSHPGMIIDSGWKETDILVDENDNPVPFQLVQSLAQMESRHRLSFTAELPSLGYRVYKVVPKDRVLQLNETSSNEPVSKEKIEDWVLENKHIKLEINPNTGGISVLQKKDSSVQVFENEGAVAGVFEDRSDTWSHGVLTFDKRIGTFALDEIKWLERGPVKSVIRTKSSFGNSLLYQDFTMYEGLSYIDVQVRIDWYEKHKLLKLLFPLALKEEGLKGVYDTPYGHIERARDGLENPGQKWIDLSGNHKHGEPCGLTVINDGKYSFSMQENEMAMTMIRSPIYAHHDPLVVDPGSDYEYIDQGWQTFTYRLVPHKGSWRKASVIKLAEELNQKPITLLESYHKGNLPLQASFVSSDSEHVIIQAMKKAQDGEDLIVRCSEIHGESCTVNISLSFLKKNILASFTPYEIKTFRVPSDLEEEIREVDLLEWDLTDPC